jgi:hypothetical protein
MFWRVSNWAALVLLIVPASQAASLVHFAEFLRFHTIFENQPVSTHGHTHDIEYLELVMPAENALMTEERQTGLPVSSQGVLIVLEQPRFIETKLLLLTDSAYFTFLTQLRGLDRDEAIQMARGACNAFRELFPFLTKQEFVSSIDQGPQFVAAFGESARAFIREKLPTFESGQLDEIGGSLEYLRTLLGNWRKSYVASADLGTHHACKLTLKPRGPAAIRITADMAQ